MVFVQSTFRVTRFARDLPLSVGGELGQGGSLSYPIPGIGAGGSGYVNVGIPGTGGPFDIYPIPGQPGFPGPFPPGAGVNPQIVKVSVPKPVAPGASITTYLWYAASYGPRQYAMRIEIPEIGYNHTTPYVFITGPGIFQIQNTFTIPADAVAGDLQGTIKLLTNEQGSTNIVVADEEPFTLTIGGGTTPTPTPECPPGATKVNNVCTCTDTTKEIWHNLCVTKCPSGYTRDAQTGVCELNTCPQGQHRNDQGVCVPDTTTPPTGSPYCDTITNPVLKNICLQLAQSTCSSETTDEADTAREFCDSMKDEECKRLCRKVFGLRREEDEEDDEHFPRGRGLCTARQIENVCKRYRENARAYARCKQIVGYQCRRRRGLGGLGGGGRAGGGAHASAGGATAGGGRASAGGATAGGGRASANGVTAGFARRLEDYYGPIYGYGF